MLSTMRFLELNVIFPYCNQLKENGNNNSENLIKIGLYFKIIDFVGILNDIFISYTGKPFIYVYKVIFLYCSCLFRICKKISTKYLLRINSLDSSD